MQSSSKLLSRREMLKLMGMTAGAAALASCAGAPPVAPAAPAAQQEAPAAQEPAAAVPAAPSGPPSDDPNQVAFGWYDEWHSPEPVELLLWGPPGDETDPWINAMKQGLARFGEHYPEITTNYEPIPWDQLDTKVNAAIAAKQGPDILFEADREAEYPRRGAIRDIPSDVVSPQFIKDRKFYEVRPLDDGKLYWIHCSAMGPILYANKTILAEAGLKPEDTPKTWDEFGKFCKDLTKLDGGSMVQAGFAFNGYSRYIWNDMIYQQGAQLYESPTKSRVDSPESKAAWQMLVDMYDTYQVNDRTFLNFDEAIGTGKAAFAQVWTWFGSALEANYPDMDWAPVTYPTFTGGGPYGRFDYDGPGWMVSTLAEDNRLMAAWELFKYHAHEYQHLVDRSHTAGLILVTDPRPDYDTMFAEVANVESPTQAQRRAQSLAVLAKQFDGGMVFPGEVAAPFDDTWRKMEEAILINQRPIDEVLAEYQKIYDEMLANTNFWITPEA